jgi:hypothetical protein
MLASLGEHAAAIQRVERQREREGGVIVALMEEGGICLLNAYWPITVRDGAIALKGSHSMGDGQIFLYSLRDTSFNKDLSNEPNFGRIHLAGQYL